MSRKRVLLTMLILVVCCASFCVTAFAASCRICVTVRMEERPVSDIRVQLCQVTSLQEDQPVLTADFAELSIPMEDLLALSAETAAQVYDYAQEHRVRTVSQKTNDAGVAEFAQLEEGLYLVSVGNGQIVKFRPYLVQLPTRVGSELAYSVATSPKSVTGNTKTVLVVKQWDDNQNAAGLRPESLQITLYQDGEAVRRVSLNAACGWQHLFAELPADCTYTVAEDPVPDYTCDVAENEDGFVLTNRYEGSDLPVNPDEHPGEEHDPGTDPDEKEEIPQAGFQMWPVYAMLILGTAMVVWGLTDLYLKREAVCEEVYEEEWEEICEEE